MGIKERSWATKRQQQDRRWWIPSLLLRPIKERHHGGNRQLAAAVSGAAGSSLHERLGVSETPVCERRCLPGPEVVAMEDGQLLFTAFPLTCL